MKYSKLGMRNIISIAVLAILYYLYWTNVAGRLLAEVQFLINYIAIPLSVGLAVHFTCIGDVGTMADVVGTGDVAAQIGLADLLDEDRGDARLRKMVAIGREVAVQKSAGDVVSVR